MSESLLYPKNTETRRKLSLDGLWKFKFDKENAGDKENWKDGLHQAELIPVPSSINDLFTDKGKREYTGTVWYETELIVPKHWVEKDLMLRFGSVTHHAEVYINGQLAGTHTGGYTPFNVPATPFVSLNEKNTIVVKVSNQLNESTLPAGSTTVNLGGEKTTTTTTDFFNYSGIQRSVNLVAVPEERIEDISLSYAIDYDKGQAEVTYDVETTGQNPVSLEISDEHDVLVAQGTGKKGTVIVENVRLWEPRNAYLYKFTWTIKSSENLIDVYTDDIGIRTVDVKGQDILINNSPIYLKGYAKYEYSPLHGAGSNLAVLKRDFELMKWSEANVIRTAQFAHDEELYRMADREGFMIINEVPGLGMASPKPNRFNPDRGKDAKPYFERQTVQSKTFEHHTKIVHDLIKRDKRYASVCMWVLMEEPDTFNTEFKTYSEALLASSRNLDSQNRPFSVIYKASSLVNNPEYLTYGDIVMLNEYYGWDEYAGYELSDSEEALSELLGSLTSVNKPVVVTGYGSESFQGEVKLPSVQWSENYQNEVFDMQHRIFDSLPFLRGEIVWSYTDYQTPEGLTAINGNNSGVFTSNRQPKTSAYLMKKRWSSLLKDAAQNKIFASKDLPV